jgi:hypothetical protein
MRALKPHRPDNGRGAARSVSVSVADEIEPHELQAALHDPKAPYQAYVRRLMEEMSEKALAGLVLDGFNDWPTLVRAAERYPPVSHEAAAWLQNMVRLAVTFENPETIRSC